MDDGSAAEQGLVGREDDLRVVAGVLQGGGSAVVVGDPGVGKTTLLRIADRLARHGGRRVLTVTPTPFDRGLPFAGLAELVAQCPAGADLGLPEPQRRALAVALQRVDPGGQVVDPLAVPLAVRGLLTQICEAEPVALVLDDLQWLDEASAGSLGFALRRLNVEPGRLSVLVGTRPDPDAGTDLIRSLPEPRHEFPLRPLADWAIGHLLRRRLGPRWTPPMSAGVARASGGNPLLALEIARAMHADVPHRYGSASDGHEPVVPVPPSLMGLLGQRVGELPQDARGVLLLVSAAGRLTVAQLHGLVGEVRLGVALEAAADADVASVSAESVVAFTHPLLASAIYDAATTAERRRAHRALAESLDDPVEQARHRSRATTAPDETVAAGLERAAEVSRGRGAQQLAGELYEGAALATPAGADTAAGLARWLRAVDTYIDAGDHLAARAALDRGSALAVAPDQKAQELVRRAWLTDEFGKARSLAERAFRLAAPGSDVRAEILHRLGVYHRMEGHGRLALRLSQLAADAAAAAARPDIQLAALNERRASERLWGMGQAGPSLRDTAPLASGSALDSSYAEWAGAHGFGAAWNDETAEGHVRDGIAWAVDAGRYGDLSGLYISLVLFLVRASKVREAQVALAEADRNGAWTTSGGVQEPMARVLTMAYSGDLDGAREVAQRALAQPRTSSSPYWRGGFLAQLGFVETSARNWTAALAALRELADIFASTQMVDLEQLLWPIDYADAALQLGAMPDVEAAIALLRRQALAGRPEAAVAADRCQALLAAARGDVDNALRELVTVVELPKAECPFEAARSRLALGQVYRRAGYKGMANDALTGAAVAFDDMGTPRWAQRARDEAARVGLRPTTGALTATERRIAELVGSGHSNQETAAELFLSVKTVESHLTRIYRKLSVRSRTELANRVNNAEPSAG